MPTCRDGKTLDVLLVHGGAGTLGERITSLYSRQLYCCTMHTADFLKGLAQLPPHRCIIVFRQPREMIPPLHDLTKPQLLVDETDPAIDTQRLLTWVFFR